MGCLGTRNNMDWQLVGSMGFDAFNSCYPVLGLVVRRAAGYPFFGAEHRSHTDRLFATGGVGCDQRGGYCRSSTSSAAETTRKEIRIRHQSIVPLSQPWNRALLHCSGHQHVAVVIHGGFCVEYMNIAQAPSPSSLFPKLPTTSSNQHGTRTTQNLVYLLALLALLARLLLAIFHTHNPGKPTLPQSNRHHVYVVLSPFPLRRRHR